MINLKNLSKSTEFRRALGHLVAYSLWILLFRLVILTLITYFLSASHARFQDISEAYGANEIVIIGLASFSYVLLLKWLNPVTKTSWEEFFSTSRFETKFAPGFLQGSTLAFAVVVALLLSGQYRYFGSLLQLEEAPLMLTNTLIRTLSLVLLAYSEEFIFRHKIQNALRHSFSDAWSLGLTALAYVGVKHLQFDLGLMHSVTLFALAVAVGLRTIIESDFVRGAGFWSAILVIFHPLLSLPVLGNDFQGILLVKYQDPTETSSETLRLLTGGVGGPLASAAFQFILLTDIIQRTVRNKKFLLNRRPRRID